jgi:hypothetical protein
MPTTDYAAEIARPDLQAEDSPVDSLQQPSDGASKPLRSLLFGFAATVTIGLALASWYVGLRIVADGQAERLSIASRVPAAPAPASVPAASPVDTEESMAEAFWYTLPPSDLFLQVAGLGPQQDSKFVRSLLATGFRARLQAGEKDNARILIGPFSTHAEMAQGQRKLQSAGILAVEMSR